MIRASQVRVGDILVFDDGLNNVPECWLITKILTRRVDFGTGFWETVVRGWDMQAMTEEVVFKTEDNNSCYPAYLIRNEERIEESPTLPERFTRQNG